VIDVEAPPGATAVAVLLHPHPDMGGTRFDHVVDSLYRGLPGVGIAAVRFDFSSSDIDVAVGEARTALAAAPDLPLAVVGYSFGTMVASHLDDERVAGWFLVAPVVDHLGPTFGADARPKALAVPEHDYSPPAHVAAVTAGWAATERHVVPGADHFLRGATPVVVELVAGWIRTTVA
jgi:alpha/beta superfamily hydrolase